MWSVCLSPPGDRNHGCSSRKIGGFRNWKCKKTRRGKRNPLLRLTRIFKFAFLSQRIPAFFYSLLLPFYSLLNIDRDGYLNWKQSSSAYFFENVQINFISDSPFCHSYQVIQILGDRFPYKLVSKKIDCKYDNNIFLIRIKIIIGRIFFLNPHNQSLHNCLLTKCLNTKESLTRFPYRSVKRLLKRYHSSIVTQKRIYA